MQYAYTIADVVVSRAGALSISELMLSAKPSILIPSPNVVDDHQTLNAQNLISHGAALMVSDSMARKMLVKTALSLLLDKNFEEARNLQLEDLNEHTCKYMEGHPDEKGSSFCGRKTVQKRNIMTTSKTKNSKKKKNWYSMAN